MTTACSGCRKEDDLEKVILSCGHTVHKGIGSRMVEPGRKRPFFQLGKDFACVRTSDEDTPLPPESDEFFGALVCPECVKPISFEETCHILDREAYLKHGSERQAAPRIKVALVNLAKAWSPEHAAELLNDEKKKAHAIAAEPSTPSSKFIKIMDLIKFYKQNPHPRMGEILTEAVMEADLKESDQEKAFGLIDSLVEGKEIEELKPAVAFTGAGTGYGGEEKVVLQKRTADQQRIFNEQIEKDKRVSAALLDLLKVIKAGNYMLGAATEAAMRREWGALSCLAEHLRNGNYKDVVQRHVVYSAVLQVCETLASYPALLPLLLSNRSMKTNIIKWSPEAAAALARVKGGADSQAMRDTFKLEGPALLESIKALETMFEAESADELALKASCNRCLELVQANRHRNPHFAMENIEEDIVQRAVRLCLDTTSSFEELANSYRRVMSRYAFRFIDMDAEAIPHFYVPGSGPPHGSKSSSDATPSTAPSLSSSTGPSTSATVPSATSLASVPIPHPRERALAIKNTIAALKTSCPVEWNSSIFCVVDENRYDILSFMIIGPDETPYQNGCFLFDMKLPELFPELPPKTIFLTTGGGKVRFNPNLYADGKICLSLLGTWSGPAWNAKESTVFQVLLSIQSLILCSQPYFNEPGYELSRGTPAGAESSKHYNTGIRMNTIKLAMIEMIKNPPKAFAEVVRNHFKLKARSILEQCEVWRQDNAVAGLDYAALVEQLTSALAGLQEAPKAGVSSNPSL